MTVVSPEDWEANYKPILSTNTDDDTRLTEMREKWGDPDEQGRGEFILVRNEVEQPKTSNFNMGSAPKPEP